MRHDPTRIRKFAAMAGAAAWLVNTGPGVADTRACRSLEADLARASGPVSPAQSQKYDRAIEKQRQQLEVALRRGDRAGCGWLQSERGDCRSLARTVERMEQNLVQLERQRETLDAGGGGDERARLLEAIEAQGCGNEDAAVRLEASILDRDNPIEEESLEESLGDVLGDIRAPELAEPETRSQVYRILSPRDDRSQAQAFRTVCVRVCDGYFFPMSPASWQGEFGRDQKRCEAACPGADISLFVQERDALDAEGMISAATGEAYGSIPNAFLYKQTDWKQPASCGCNTEKGFSIVSGDRASPSASPPGETIAAPAKIFTPRKPDEDRKVRVVGPSFLPDPSAAIDLQVPARKPAQ